MPSCKCLSLVAIALVICALVGAGEGRVPFACDPNNGLTRGFKFCRTLLPIHVRVQDLIGRLTLPEKIRLVVNNAIEVPRLGIQGYEWWSEALHGVSDVGPGTKFGGAFPGATSFPQVVSDEARAMYNGGVAGLTYWSPNVNIFRDPRWGRGQETPGEDPVLAGKYAVSYVRGLQGDGAGNRLKVAACCKHYTAYDVDNWKGIDRFHFNAKVSKQDLEDTYNAPFKSCVLEGKVASVMCSYNQVNGKPTCADPDLLRNTIRGQWHLNGYIVSDCDSVATFYDTQHYTKTPEEAAAVAIKAGLDLDCGPFLALHTDGAIKQGLITENDLNLALANIITVQMRLGMFDGAAQPYGNLGPRDVCTQAHQELALEAARQGIVLLKNKGNALPLSPQHQHIVGVIGPNSDATVTMIGNYAGVACGYTTPLQGIARYVKTAHHVGCRNVACHANDLFGKAEVVARHTDSIVLVMGLDQSIEAEFKDRVGLLLPGHQQELVSRVAKAAKGPVILVIMSGGPVDVTFAKNDPKISAILWVGYPGQAGGTAIADAIFGTINPGGRLPNTWYPQDYVEKLPMTNMDMRSNPVSGYPGRTYRFYKGPVVFPFGYGLSYTRFTHTLAIAPKQVSVPLTSLDALRNTTFSSKAMKVSHANCDALEVGFHVDVKNVGLMDGSETVLIFSKPPTGKWNSVKQLVGFNKVHVPSGSKLRVKVGVNVCNDFSIVDEFGVRRIPIGKHELYIGDIKHSISVQIKDGKEELED
ncbi:unnamed protein product [Lupinus luteus]|uniref:Fibronectin type III-like domain-containing protein n=1 Tax=Lupinus luteus TaxID=3873 RepID=A0AAV1YLH6_LUPLU